MRASSTTKQQQHSKAAADVAQQTEHDAHAAVNAETAAAASRSPGPSRASDTDGSVVELDGALSEWPLLKMRCRLERAMVFC